MNNPVRTHREPCFWCPIDKPCHADILLRMANEDGENADPELHYND